MALSQEVSPGHTEKMAFLAVAEMRKSVKFVPVRMEIIPGLGYLVAVISRVPIIGKSAY